MVGGVKKCYGKMVNYVRIMVGKLAGKRRGRELEVIGSARSLPTNIA